MRTIGRIIISVLYIMWGIAAPLTALKALLAFDLGAVLSAGVGILMLFAGIFGLIRIKRIKCRIFGIIIFICAASTVVVSLMEGALAWQAIVSAVLAWLFIACL